jgi:hypothetical protein
MHQVPPAQVFKSGIDAYLHDDLGLDLDVGQRLLAPELARPGAGQRLRPRMVDAASTPLR